MSGPMQKFPKAILHEFYQMHSCVPQFVVEPANAVSGEPRFRCQLTCPEVTARHKTFPTTIFTADARTKRSAEHAASDKALDALRKHGVVSPTAFPRPQGSSGPPVVTKEEVARITQRLVVLSAQLTAQALERQSKLRQGLQEVSEEINVDELTIEEARALYKAALAERKQLKAQRAEQLTTNRLAIDAIEERAVVPLAQ